jgi:hypothetical protein
VPFREPALSLRDIADSITQFTQGMDAPAFRSDPKTVAAVERKLQVISEAAIRLGDQAEALCPVFGGATSVASATGSGINMTALMSKRSGRR